MNIVWQYDGAGARPSLRGSNGLVVELEESLTTYSLHTPLMTHTLRHGVMMESVQQQPLLIRLAKHHVSGSAQEVLVQLMERVMGEKSERWHDLLWYLIKPWAARHAIDVPFLLLEHQTLIIGRHGKSWKRKLPASFPLDWFASTPGVAQVAGKQIALNQRHLPDMDTLDTRHGKLAWINKTLELGDLFGLAQKDVLKWLKRDLA